MRDAFKQLDRKKKRAEILEETERAIADEDQGEFFKQHGDGLVDRIVDEESFAKQTTGKHLDDFISGNDKMQEDDDDIYKEYQEMASRRQERMDYEREQSMDMSNLNDIQKDTPRFDDYFDSQAQGVHPFEKIKNSYDRETMGTPWEDRQHEEEREKELYRRELLGRLFGGNLTPRQY